MFLYTIQILKNKKCDLHLFLAQPISAPGTTAPLTTSISAAEIGVVRGAVVPAAHIESTVRILDKKKYVTSITIIIITINLSGGEGSIINNWVLFYGDRCSPN